MLYLFGFEKIAVALSDLYFVDPNPNPGQEGAERGVRLEVRFLDRAPLKGSIYSAQPIGIDAPIWRADLLESVASAPGSFDRTHHHPRFSGWEPSKRNFVTELSAAPLEWVGQRLANLGELVDEAGVDRSAIPPDDYVSLRRAVPEIIDTLRRLLRRVHAGELGHAPHDGVLTDARAGWL